MTWKLETANSGTRKELQEHDIHRAFDVYDSRCEFIILTAPDGRFVQAAGDDNVGMVLEFSEGNGEMPVRAVGEFDKETVRQSFLSFFNDEQGWRNQWQWEPIESLLGDTSNWTESKSGCASIVLVYAGIGAGLMWGISQLASAV